MVDEVEVHEHSYHDLEGLAVRKQQVVELVANREKREIRDMIPADDENHGLFQKTFVI